jgi:lysophospholipase L1-like esterase/phosphoserine phosphatase
MTNHTSPDASAVRQSKPASPQSGPGVTLPVAALVALTAAVIWFGIAPAPPAAPKTAAPGGPRVEGGATGSSGCGGCSSPVAGVATTGLQSAVTVDPLPSWNDGPVKQSITEFVANVTREGSDTYVPVPERVAVFDHDGTLVCEKPIVHGMFLIERIRALAERQPEIAHEEPYATLLTGDIDFVRRLGKKYFLDLMFTTLAGVPEEKLEADARQFLATARHPVFDVPYAEVTYQPMKELIALLRSHDFSVWICSGSGVHFMRPAAEAWYGIGPEHVIASRAASELREFGGDDAGEAAGGAANRRLELVVMPHLAVLNDEERKPVSIGEQIGRRPIFAAGNVGTTGDIEMLRWSQSSRHPSLQLLVLHDDATREMAYGEPSNDSLEAAANYGWSVVRMATDWNRIFTSPLEKKTASLRNPSAPATSGEVAAVEVAARPASPVPLRLEKAIADYEKADREQPPEAGGVVFLGSSNISLWNTLGGDFPGLGPVNRGVGGATLAELAVVVERLVSATRPRAVVVSAGSNDVAAGATADQVRGAFELLVKNLRRELPEVRVAFLAIAPSIRRWEQRERQAEANAAVREFIAAQGEAAGLAYIDANEAFLGPDGSPAGECFLDDQLHPSTIGNARRAAIIRPLLHDLLP